MTIIFAGGEDTSFSVNRGSAGFFAAQNFGSFRSGYARGSIAMYGAYPVAVPPNGPKLRIPTASLTDFWVHFWLYAGSNVNSPGNQFISIGSGNGAIIQGSEVLVRNTTTVDGTITNITYTLELSTDPGHLSVATWNPPSIETAGTLTFDVPGYWTIIASASNLYQADLLYGVDMHFAAGTLTLYLNGDEVLTGSIGGGIPSYVEVMGISTNTSASYYSEFLVEDEPTLGKDIFTLAPAANGNTNTWTGTVSNINEWTINDFTYNSTTADAAPAQYTVTYSLPSGAYNVEGLIIEARLAVGLTGPQTFDRSMRTTDGTDHVATATAEPNTYFDNYSTIQPINPETGFGWLPTDFQTGFNLGVVSEA